MPETLRPLTVLLAAIALWALAVLGLALFGLGARFGPHPDDPSLAPALPVVTLQRGGSPLGPVTDYIEVGNRPLLSPDRRPPPISAVAGGDSGAPLDAMLTSVLIAGDVKLAILQEADGSEGKRVRLGDTLEGTAWRLVALEPRQAVFEGPTGQRTLQLRTFDGRGGVAPTAVAPPLADAAAAQETDEPLPAPEPDIEPPEVSSPTPVTPTGQGMSQEAQVEAIRRRIEARRAQMRAEAARAAGQKVE